MASSSAVAGCVGTLAVLIALVFAVRGYASLDNTTYGIQYSWWSETVHDNNGKAFGPGIYFPGLFTSFITFPSKIETLEWAPGSRRPAILSRTNDGLAVELECSLQYQLNASTVSSLYHTLGTWDQAEQYMEKVAHSIIMTEATHYTAEEFFANRTTISPLMERTIRAQFETKLFVLMQFFQLQEVKLPPEFEHAVKNTTETNQKITIYEAAKNRSAVEWETELLQMRQHLDVRINKAHADATEIELRGQAAGQTLILQALGNASAILQQSRARANASTTQRRADAESVRASKRTEAATVRLQSITYFNATNHSYYLQAAAYGSIRQHMASEEQFLEFMKVKALQNVSWSRMSVNLADVSDPLAFMGLAPR